MVADYVKMRREREGFASVDVLDENEKWEYEVYI